MGETINNKSIDDAINDNAQLKDAYSLLAVALEYPDLPEIVCVLSETYLLVYDRGPAKTIDSFFCIDYNSSTDVVVSNLPNHYNSITLITNSGKIMETLRKKCYDSCEGKEQFSGVTAFIPKADSSYRIYSIKAEPTLDYVCE